MLVDVLHRSSGFGSKICERSLRRLDADPTLDEGLHGVGKRVDVSLKGSSEPGRGADARRKTPWGWKTGRRFVEGFFGARKQF